MEERRFSAASSAITRKTGFSPCGRLSLGHRKLARNGTTSVVPQSHKNPVIPNRAESPVRILLLADAISEGWVRGIPRLAKDARHGAPGRARLQPRVWNRRDLEERDFSRAARTPEMGSEWRRPCAFGQHRQIIHRVSSMPGHSFCYCYLQRLIKSFRCRQRRAAPA